MFLDNLLLLSDAQAFTGAATVSTNTIDLGPSVPARGIGTGEPMVIGCSVDVAAGAGSTALIEVIQSAAAALTSPDVIGSFTDIAANLPAGRIFNIGIPNGYPTKRYLGIRETSTGGTTTITLTVWLTTASLFSIASQNYAKNYTP